MSFLKITVSVAAVMTFSFAAHAANVEFAMPKDGAKVSSPVHVKMNVSGMNLRKAGEDPKDKSSGHFHIIIDAPPVAEGQVIPTDVNHVHFGKAQSEADVPLSKGKHTLTLQLADGAHISYGPKMSATVHVDVQ